MTFLKARLFAPLGGDEIFATVWNIFAFALARRIDVRDVKKFQPNEANRLVG